MEAVKLFLCLALCLCLWTEPTIAMDCYECNLHLCSRDVPAAEETEECKKFHEAMAMDNMTARSIAMDEVNKLNDGCSGEPELKGNCKACIKVDTTASYIGSRGKQYASRVISKVCAKEKPVIEEDNCESNGPKYARAIYCICYGDNCNSASAVTFSLVAFTSVLLATLL